jgi:hypothetical protein
LVPAPGLINEEPATKSRPSDSWAVFSFPSQI